MSQKIWDFFRRFKDYRAWEKRSFAGPSPAFVKRTRLVTEGALDATWVETGTFLGRTTAFLARHARQVFSIEPDPKLFADANDLFKGNPGVEIIHGLSENVFPELLPKLSGDVNFWLDGHYSAGRTFKGPIDTPIKAELDSISANLHRFGAVNIFIDDVRCFRPDQEEFAHYPALTYLVDWANAHNFTWTIEHDIFIAKRSG